MLKTFILAGGIIVMFKLLINNNPNFENTVANLKSEFYRFIYNCIYYYSVCQLKYKKLSCYVNPYLHYIYSSENQYRKEMCPLLKSNSDEKCKNNIYVSFYNNTGLIKKAIYNYDSHCVVSDLNLFVKNVEPVNYNLIIMSLLEKQKLEKQRETETNSKQYDMIIFTSKNMSDFTNITKYDVSNIKFISINLIHNNNTYQILLKTPEYNFYIVDNIIDATFFKYYLVNIVKEKNNGLDNNFSYTLEIMDHNVNMFTLNEKQSIIFKKDSYDILQCDTTREIVIEKIDSVSKIDTVDTSRY
jgi:phage terminase large subunit-like protein